MMNGWGSEGRPHRFAPKAPTRRGHDALDQAVTMSRNDRSRCVEYAGDRVNPLTERWMGYPMTYPALKHSALPAYD